ncbi:MAG TPA: hypothetical protein VHC22_26940 [Pirellulales bacterium]|nr:hypothetical protein [Pirellulales bacterium]
MRKPRSCLARMLLLGSMAIAVCHQGVAVAAEKLKIEVRETAGIRRFGYPIALALPDLPLASADGHLRLREDGKPVSAQFRQDQTGGDAGPWWLDFNISMMPHEIRNFVLEYGPDVMADPEPTGLVLEQTPNGLDIRNGNHLTWTLGRGPRDLLTSVNVAGVQHLRPVGTRLGIEGPHGLLDDLGDETRAPRIIRSGPLAVAIRYEFTPRTSELAETKSIVDLTFPVSKSWVQVDWRIDDVRQAVRSMHVEVAQNLDSPTETEPTLIDFGAASLVYMSLPAGTAGKLQAAPAATEPQTPARQMWNVLRGNRNRLEPFTARPAVAGGDAEGWAHVMDRTRCLALAVDGFGRGGDDSIETTAEGNVSIVRRFAARETARAATKRLTFWLHFVGFPPHVTAATSPQSMLSPLVVRVSKL